MRARDTVLGWSLAYGAALIFVLIICVGSLFPAKAFAQDVANGELIAKTWCAGCHRVDSSGAALQNAAVPAFQAIAQAPGTNQASLRIFLSTPHPKMASYGLSRDEIQDVSSYILSLRK